ncbi:hypothetical protein CHS0354_008466 [Potamilus streckersoni]|uniref:Uncharacterized protein n=1 Tax=Potamilus streckersoni TaxID=2493646 RepID=A0AAE0RPY2_9BIVA|nr:hypothetical protein CHS0354_008466 [Potamilus streckersoni]
MQSKLDVEHYTAMSNGHSEQGSVRFLVIEDSNGHSGQGSVRFLVDSHLQMTRKDYEYLLVTGCGSGQLQDFSNPLHHDGSQLTGSPARTRSA